MSEQPVMRADQTLSDSQLSQRVPPTLDTPPPVAPETVPPADWKEQPEPVQRLGRFEVHAEIGRGGMGAVFRGRDSVLCRDLALKVLLADHKGNANVVRRFHEEAQIGGQLQHPGVVPVYELGADSDGRPFFAMKLVKGRTLAALLQERKSPTDDLPRLLTIFEQICQTLAYAHDRRVIHRDLKPANVMVGAFGEVQVMDWGLAKVLTETGQEHERREQTAARSRIRTEADGAASRAGTVLGTPAYMPPEQARGESELLDQRADVFGLGSILCEILTSRPPFIGRNSNEVLARACRGDVADAIKRLDACGADPELVELAKVCLAPEVDGRPRDGSAVAEQVAAYRAGVAKRLRAAELERAAAEVRAVEEQKRAAVEQAAAETRVIEERKRAILEREKRRRTQALAAAAFLLLLGVGGGGWWWQQQRVQAVGRQREAEQRIGLALDDARDRLDQAKRTAQAELYPEAKASLDKAREVARTSQVRSSIRSDIEVLEQRWQTELAATNKGRFLLIACLEVGQLHELPRYERSESRLMTALAEPSADEQFARAFRTWDPEFDAAKPEDAYQRLQALPEPLIQELVAALDEWWQARRNARPTGDWHTLHDLADRLDSNERRREMRGLFASGELEREQHAAYVASAVLPLTEWLWIEPRGLDQVLGAAALTVAPSFPEVAHSVGRNRRRLRELAGQLDLRREPVLTVLALSRALSRSGDEVIAEKVLVSALTARPNEAVLLMALGALLERRHPPRLDRTIEYYRAARAIRSNFGVALAKALSDAGRSDEGEAVLRELLRGQSDHPELHFYLGYALSKRKVLSAAQVEYSEAIRLKPDFPQAHNNLGNVLYGQGKLPEAVAEYRAAIQLKPDFHEAYYNFGNVLCRQGNLPEALAKYREAIRLMPNYAEAHSNLGLALKDQGKLPEAVVEFCEAIRLKPDFPEAHYNLGIALADQGKLPEAEAAYRELLRLTPNDPEAHYNVGVTLYGQKKLPEAIVEFCEAIRLKPDLPEAHYGLGGVLMDLGKLPEAIAAYREAIRVKPNYAEAHNNLGRALKDQDKLPEAVVEFREAIRFKPSNAIFHQNLGTVLKAQGKFLEAEAEYRVAVHVKPDDPATHISLGNVLMNQRKLQDALAEYRVAVRLKPEDPEARISLGNALKEQGELPKAIVEYREAIRLKPDFAEGHNNLGSALYLQGKFPEAVTELRRVIQLKPDYADAHNNLGRALAAQRNLPEAVAEYREAIRLKPNLAQAHNNLGAVLKAQDKLTEAIAEYREAIRIKPDYPEAHNSMGAALQLQGSLPEAVVEYREAIRLKPSFPEAHFNLGLVLRDLGEFEASHTAFQRGHELGVKTPGRRYPSEQWVRDAERLVELDRCLPRLLDGSLQPTTPGECLEYVSLCMHPARRFHIAAARLAADAFLSEPKLAADLKNQHRYNAARSAALAAAGQAQDAKKLPDKVSTGLRRQALLFLRADLALYAKLAESDQAATKEAVRQRLAHWQQDADLAMVRDAIDQLPETERAAWRQLWQDVAALLKRVEPPK